MHLHLEDPTQGDNPLLIPDDAPEAEMPGYPQPIPYNLPHGSVCNMQGRKLKLGTLIISQQIYDQFHLHLNIMHLHLEDPA